MIDKKNLKSINCGSIKNRLIEIYLIFILNFYKKYIRANLVQSFIFGDGKVFLVKKKKKKTKNKDTKKIKQQNKLQIFKIQNKNMIFV